MPMLLWCLKNWRVILAVGLLVALAAAGAYLYRAGKQNAAQGLKIAQQANEINNLSRVIANERRLRQLADNAISQREADYEKIETSYTDLRNKYSRMRVVVRCNQSGGNVPTVSSSETPSEEGSERIATREFDLGAVAERIIKLGKDYDACVADFNMVASTLEQK